MTKQRIFGLTVLIAIGLALPAQGFTVGTGDPVNTAPGPQAWVDAAREGTPLSISTATGTLDLDLTRNDDLFADDASVPVATGDEVDLSKIHALEGHVEGVPDSWVAVTATQGFVTGVVVAPGLGTFGIGSLEDGGYGVVDGSELPPIGRTFEEPGWSAEQATPSDPVRGHATNQCLQLVPHHVANPTGRILEHTPHLVYNVSFSVDQAFVNSFSDWETRAVSYIGAADTFYNRTQNVSIQAHDLHNHSGAFPGATTDQLLEDAKQHYNNNHDLSDPDLDGTHVITGKNLGGAIGQANCIGGAGDPHVAYSVSMGDHLDSFKILGFDFLTNAYVKVLTHEIGHLMTAHHHYANCAESATAYTPTAPIEACTLMGNFIDTATLSWSTVNELTTRGWNEHAGI